MLRVGLRVELQGAGKNKSAHRIPLDVNGVMVPAIRAGGNFMWLVYDRVRSDQNSNFNAS
jgi:hypothetical protein